MFACLTWSSAARHPERTTRIRIWFAEISSILLGFGDFSSQANGIVYGEPVKSAYWRGAFVTELLENRERTLHDYTGCCTR
jgi:hypothetical protein